MRITASLTEQDLSLSMAQEGTERYVPLGNFVPIKTGLTSFFTSFQASWIIKYTSGVIRSMPILLVWIGRKLLLPLGLQGAKHHWRKRY